MKGLYTEIAKMLDLYQRKQNVYKTHQVHLLDSSILTKLGGGMDKMSVVKVVRREQVSESLAEI